jgi:CTP synthase (UTP-ammonia lyase)
MTGQNTMIVIGIVGDRNQQYRLHLDTENALRDGPDAPSVEWMPTDQVGISSGHNLSRYAGFLISPGSYRNMENVLAIIRYARENCVPLLGTCGGFQHLILEFARNVAGVSDAGHEETNPAANHLVVTALECSLVQQICPVRLIPDTQVAAIYAVEESLEPFYCNYGLNPKYRSLLESTGITVCGLGERGEVRAVELPAHPFFVGTLYVPQARYKPGRSHPIIRAFVAAARLEHLSAQRLRA